MVGPLQTRFRRQVKILPPPMLPYRFSNDLFRAPIAINRSRVDQIHPMLKHRKARRHGIALRHLAPLRATNRPRPQPNARNPRRIQREIFHASQHIRLNRPRHPIPGGTQCRTSPEEASSPPPPSPPQAHFPHRDSSLHKPPRPSESSSTARAYPSPKISPEPSSASAPSATTKSKPPVSSTTPRPM